MTDGQGKSEWGVDYIPDESERHSHEALDIDKDTLEKYDEEFTMPLAKRYADQTGEKIADSRVTDNQTYRAMAIAYAAECDQAAGLDILADPEQVYVEMRLSDAPRCH